MTIPRANKTLLLVVQRHSGGIHPVSVELAQAAVSLAGQGGLRAVGIFITGQLTAAAKNGLQRLGLEEIHIYEDPRYYPFTAELHSAALVHCAGILKPEILLVGATPEGRILAPAAAIPLNTGVTADCTELHIENGLLIQTRPAFGGGVMARIITANARPQIATVRYGILKGGDKNNEGQTVKTRLIKAAIVPFPPAAVHAEIVTENSLTEIKADRILALGAGIRAREDIDLFRNICAAYQMELMCSRSLVERGWFPQSRQIGLSGNSVSPRLLLAMGISGSVQFMAGIQGAQKLIAINSDPDAPLLRAAGIPIVGDLYPIAGQLLSGIRSKSV
ncbi:MAG: electron transfer flavoprotein subunit alpha/FixB family protein [Treponema sp.]|jgi:electron transfer flavoprotein alpha subunit|nr:electron transfer flavoprotein subunit alpha/FixB family protein [Treponema sp.]